MDRFSPVGQFAEEWLCWLRKEGHKIKPKARTANVIRSKNGHDQVYRWLIFHSEKKVRRFTASDHEYIQRQLKTGKREGDYVFVVVKFDQPTSKVVVIPAYKAATMAKITSMKGGIEW